MLQKIITSTVFCAKLLVFSHAIKHPQSCYTPEMYLELPPSQAFLRKVEALSQIFGRVFDMLLDADVKTPRQQMLVALRAKRFSSHCNNRTNTKGGYSSRHVTYKYVYTYLYGSSYFPQR